MLYYIIKSIVVYNKQKNKFVLEQSDIPQIIKKESQDEMAQEEKEKIKEEKQKEIIQKAIKKKEIKEKTIQQKEVTKKEVKPKVIKQEEAKPKRKRGRPRKVEQKEQEPKPKRKRGRPKKPKAELPEFKNDRDIRNYLLETGLILSLELKEQAVKTNNIKKANISNAKNQQYKTALSSLS